MTKLLLCVALALLWVALPGCDDSKQGLVGTDDHEAIALVEEGAFASYPDTPIGAAAACYFDTISWSSLFANDGYSYVNLEGHGLSGAASEAILQFRIFRASATFTLHAMEVDGVAQPDSAVLVLVAQMVACDEEE